MNKKYLFRNLIKEKEPSINSCLNNIKKVIFFKRRLRFLIYRSRHYYDEPKFWKFFAVLNNLPLPHNVNKFDTQGSGFSFFSKHLALLKCLCEAVERYCNYIFQEKYIDFVGTFKQIKTKAINPIIFASFSEKQLKKKKFNRFVINKNSVFRWTKCASLVKNKVVYVPSQIIYLSYQFLKKERTIYPTLSTGVAAGGCRSSALLRGILEIVERDAFMIYYLNELPAKKIRLESFQNSRIRDLVKMANRYKFKILSLDLTTDLKIPVVASILINKTKIGSAISVGLKSSLNPTDAIIGSIEESFHSLSWIRKEYEKNRKRITSNDLLRNSDILTRGFLWYKDEAIKNLDFWINSPNKIVLHNKNELLTSGKQLEKVVKIFQENKMDILFKDLMIPQLKDFSLFVVKTIIPEMQPLYLNEKYPLLGGDRLYNVPVRLGFKKKTENELNKYPHPFL